MKKPNTENTTQNLNDIINFLDASVHFDYRCLDSKIELTQLEDTKRIHIDLSQVEKILDRQDVDGSRFLQINFLNNHKILLTKSLVGFKPNEMIGFDLTRIPRVVTTVDLKSVSKAIEDLYDSEDSPETRAEIEVLKKVYQSILFGAEGIGFKMSAEKTWLMSILLNRSAAIA